MICKTCFRRTLALILDNAVPVSAELASMWYDTYHDVHVVELELAGLRADGSEL